MLKGKVAVVTGSTSGIGLGIATALAAQGADIVLNGFGDAAEIEKVRAGLAAQHGVKVLHDGADLSKGDAVRGLVDNAVRQMGRIDILVNNAGIQHTALIEDFPTEKWDAILALNLSAVFHGTAAALPHMKKQGFGRIINIASAHGLVASANKSAYVAAKHGVVGFTKVTALETAGQGITANAICPGWVRTPLVESRSRRWPRRTASTRKPPRVNCSAKSSRRCSSSRPNNWAARPSSWPPMPPRKSPAPPSPSMAAGRRADQRNLRMLFLLSPPRSWTTTRRCMSRPIPSRCSWTRPPP